jgi:hypothetical protein
VNHNPPLAMKKHEIRSRKGKKDSNFQVFRRKTTLGGHGPSTLAGRRYLLYRVRKRRLKISACFFGVEGIG